MKRKLTSDQLELFRLEILGIYDHVYNTAESVSRTEDENLKAAYRQFMDRFFLAYNELKTTYEAIRKDSTNA
jgi:hypothetical protein